MALQYFKSPGIIRVPLGILFFSQGAGSGHMPVHFLSPLTLLFGCSPTGVYQVNTCGSREAATGDVMGESREGLLG